MDPLYIHPATARRLFREFAAGEITNENLARGALLIALEEEPRLDIEAYLAELDDLTLRVMKRTRTGEPPVFRLGHLHAEMFDVDGYAGDEDNYYDPRNARLDQVIDRKRGLPIALSIVFLHVASRIGLNAAGVGLPGHFIVKVQFELNELFIDPFHAGATLARSEIGALIGGRVTSEHLRAWSGRDTLKRVLGNLASMWARAGDPRRAQAAQERIAILDTLASE